jgi:hypothetical protein
MRRIGGVVALCAALGTAIGASAAPQALNVPVMTDTWAITANVLAYDDPTGFLGPTYAVGASNPRTWRFEQTCVGTPADCETDLVRVTDLGESKTRISYRGNNEFAWAENLASSVTCGSTTFEASTVHVDFVMKVQTVPIPTGRPFATSLEAVGIFVATMNQAGYANAGCPTVPPAQIRYTVRYTGDSPNPPPTGAQVYGGPAPGLSAGTIKLPGSGSFVPMTAGQNVPPGTIVDVSKGRGVTLADPKGQTSVFSGEKDAVPSQFVYAGVVGGFVELRLTGGNFKACPKRVVQSAAAEKPVRRLWGKGKGKFRTKGRYASAAIRGTWWLTADYCSRTFVRVKEGSVTVVDIPKKKTVIVKAPKSYSAAKKK